MQPPANFFGVREPPATLCISEVEKRFRQSYDYDAANRMISGANDKGDTSRHVYANYTGHSYDVILGISFSMARFNDPANRTWLAQNPVKGWGEEKVEDAVERTSSTARTMPKTPCKTLLTR